MSRTPFSAFVLLPVAFTFAGLAPSSSAQQAVTTGTPRLRAARAVTQSPTGPAALLSKVKTSRRTAISVVAGDFGGIHKGLVTGYAMGSGGVLAVQQGTDLSAGDDAAGSAFAPATQLLELALRPDLLLADDLNGDGQQDLVVAARGGSMVQVLAGDGHGNFTPGAPIAVAGSITSLAVWRSGSGAGYLAAGVCVPGGCAIDLYGTDGKLAASAPVTGEPGILIAAQVNGHGAPDLIAGGASALSVIDGAGLLTGSPHVDALPVSGAVAAAVGSFVYDARGMQQIAVLTRDGSVHTLTRTGRIATPPAFTAGVVPGGRGHGTAKAAIAPATLGWSDAEVLPGVAPPDGNGRPLLLRSRLSGSGEDDLLILNGNGGQITAVGHATVSMPADSEHATSWLSILPARVSDEGASSAPVQGAVAMRVSQSAAWGLVTAEGTEQPMLAALSAAKNLYVRTTSDSAVTSAQMSACIEEAPGCTLRAAMAQVNADASTNESSGMADTVNLPAGTFTLSASVGAEPDSNGNYNYHIEVDGPFNLIGAGASTTLINANNLDKVFSINPGYAVQQAAFDVYMSGVTLENGTNRNPYFNSVYNYKADSLGGLLDYDTYDTGDITFVNCNFTAGTALYGDGGGIYVSDNILAENSTAFGPGTLEVDGGTFSGNKTAEKGGAISTATDEVNGDVPILINGVTFTSNIASHTISSASSVDTSTSGLGGAVYFGADQNAKTSIIENSIFTSNTAAQKSGVNANAGGGGLYAGSGLTITNSQFLSNTSGYQGGGVYTLSATTSSNASGGTVSHSATITGSTFTSNTAVDGGGVFLYNEDENGGGGLSATIQYNRFFGNTASTTVNGGTRTGLAVGTTDGNPSNSVLASENFWGCNTGANTTNCDSARASLSGDGLTLTPYAVVTAALSPSSLTAGQSFTLTGSLNSDSAGTRFSGAQLNPFTGVAETSLTASSGAYYTSTSPGGTVSQTLTITQNSSTLGTQTSAANTATQTSLAETTSSAGTVTGTVKIDNATATVTAPVTISSPTIAIAFAPTSIAVGANSNLTFTLNNPNPSVSETGVAFSDTLPAGLVVASTPAISNTCGGAVTAGAGSGTISLGGGVINQSTSCTISVSVTGQTVGAKNDTTGPITSTNESAGGGTSNAATLTVKATPAITLAAPAAFTDRGAATTLTATVTVPAGDPAPTAQVTFYAGSTSLGTVSLGNVNATTYTATLTTSALPSGTQTLTAQYLGDTNYSSITSTGQSTYVVANNVWIANGNGTVSAYQPNGTPLISTAETGGGSGVAIDSTGHVWSAKASSNTLAEFSNTGAVLNAGYTGGGLSAPANLAIDGSGMVWVLNGNNSVSVFTNSGTAFSSTAYTGGQGGVFSTPTTLSIDTSGNLWVANSGNSTVTEVLGSATPVVQPLAAGVANNTTGSTP